MEGKDRRDLVIDNLLSTLAAATPGETTGLDMLTELAGILCVAAVTTVLFQKIKQPVVLGYLLAGLIVGSHFPFPVFANQHLTHELSELGVVLLMFSLGLDFSLRKLIRVAPTAGVVAVIQCSLMIWLGYMTARAFGWTGLEGLFAGALIAISSTTIIVKAFAEQGVKGKIAEFVFGILIVEDLIAILLLAIITPIASGASLSAGGFAWTIARLGTFLVAMLVFGIFLVPRAVRLIVRIGRTETTVVASIGLCFACALLARYFGYSVALGAFMAGALVAESGHGKAIEHAMEPVRDLFAAVFFVSVGMLIDPALVAQHWLAVLVLTVVVIVGKVFGVTLGSFLAGRSIRTSVQAGMSLAQIGEFSFIIAGVGLSLGATRSFLYPIAVAVSAVTTLVTPFLIRLSGPAANFVDAHLPPPFQTFVSLYGSWLQGLGATPAHKTAWSEIRRLLRLLITDLVAITVIVITVSSNLDRMATFAGRYTHIEPQLLRWLLIAGAFALTVPFHLGAIRVARALAAALVAEALPNPVDNFDRVAASRRALLVTLQLAILLFAGIPLAALTQPFLPSFPVVIVLLLGALVLIVPLWRSATNLHGHVRAGAQVLLESLATQTKERPEAESRADMRKLVPGLGATTTVRLTDAAPTKGRTLKDINLRGLTGATVIAIDRGEQDIVYPSADEVLRAGDVLVLAGTEESVGLATEVLLGNNQNPAASA
jgi:CPA2 family monovalent cation:H+ antiporter-2